MSGKQHGGGGGSRNLANAALMSSPYAAVAVVETSAALGPAAVVGGGVAVGALAARTALRRRQTPAVRARRELRRAARLAHARTIGSPAKRRRGSLSGTGTARRSAARSGTSSGTTARGGRTAGRKTTAAHGTGSGRGGRVGGRTGTSLLDRRAGRGGNRGSVAGQSRSGRGSRPAATRHGGTGRASRPLGRPGRRAGFGQGPRAAAMRGRAARRGRVGLLGGGLSAWRRRSRAAKRVRAGLPVSQRLFGTAHPTDWRNAAARAARRRRALMRSGMWSRLGKLANTRGFRTVRASWAPMRRAMRRRGGSRVGRAVLGVAGLVSGVLGTTAGAVMLLPRMANTLRVVGLVTHREVCILRSAIAAWCNPFTPAAAPITATPAARTASRNTGTTTGGQMAEGKADHLEALIEHITNAGQIEKFVGLDVEAHAHAVARVLHALGEYLGGSVELIKENLPQLDGGESLVQQVDLVAAAASGATECASAFSDVHEDRLKRQREPEQGEENWDVSAVQD